MAKLPSKYTVDGDAGCWVWGGFVKNGQPMAKRGGVHVSVRRLLYIEKFGHLSDDSQVRCGCGNSLCVNPDHARVLTEEDRANAALISEVVQLYRQGRSPRWIWSKLKVHLLQFRRRGFYLTPEAGSYLTGQMAFIRARLDPAVNAEVITEIGLVMRSIYAELARIRAKQDSSATEREGSTSPEQSDLDPGVCPLPERSDGKENDGVTTRWD